MFFNKSRSKQQSSSSPPRRFRRRFAGVTNLLDHFEGAQPDYHQILTRVASSDSQTTWTKFVEIYWTLKRHYKDRWPSNLFAHITNETSEDEPLDLQHNCYPYSNPDIEVARRLMAIAEEKAYQCKLKQDELDILLTLTTTASTTTTTLPDLMDEYREIIAITGFVIRWVGYRFNAPTDHLPSALTPRFLRDTRELYYQDCRQWHLKYHTVLFLRHWRTNINNLDQIIAWRSLLIEATYIIITYFALNQKPQQYAPTPFIYNDAVLLLACATAYVALVVIVRTTDEDPKDAEMITELLGGAITTLSWTDKGPTEEYMNCLFTYLTRTAMVAMLQPPQHLHYHHPESQRMTLHCLMAETQSNYSHDPVTHLLSLLRQYGFLHSDTIQLLGIDTRVLYGGGEATITSTAPTAVIDKELQMDNLIQSSSFLQSVMIDLLVDVKACRIVNYETESESKGTVLLNPLIPMSIALTATTTTTMLEQKHINGTTSQQQPLQQQQQQQQPRLKINNKEKTTTKKSSSSKELTITTLAEW